ncbi:MAG: plasmid pRiA4b ORF-3-like family protein [Noviherbaspirillum sp.]|nr:plasmid pRiA4b ORF-3-like family protein [Noviherbaspirillum sp.]
MATQHKVIPLHITIDGIDPPIWRKVALDGDMTLRTLHHVIQAAFGWADAHLHEFVVEEQTYSMLDNDNVLDMIEDPDQIPLDDRKAKLQRLVYPGQTFTYLYDFGDNWTHLIKVEKIETRMQKMGAAYIIDGGRAGPPEDVGGVHGYEDFLNAIKNRRRSQEARDYLQWVDGEFEPEAFDRRIANNALLRMAWNGWGKK